MQDDELGKSNHLRAWSNERWWEIWNSSGNLVYLTFRDVGGDWFFGLI
jgi:hypothetical protein